jgi:hypothetical protein
VADLHLSGDPEADRLISDNPLALVIAMVLDQQIPLEWAFSAPRRLKERLGGELDAAEVAAMDPDELGEHIWTTAATGDELLRRIKALPGFGEQKAKIFLALLGKQLGVQPPGWQEAAGPFGQPGTFMSVADITGPDTLAEVRDYKRAKKAAAKAAAEA